MANEKWNSAVRPVYFARKHLSTSLGNDASVADGVVALPKRREKLLVGDGVILTAMVSCHSIQ